MTYKLSALIGLSHLASVAFLAIPIAAGPVDSSVPMLSAVVSGPDSVTDVENLHLTVTVTNTGKQSVKLVGGPWGPLTTSPTNLFLISGPKKATPAFTGIGVKYAGIGFVAANGQDGDFTVLAAGQSVNFTHDLSKGYNFEGSGVGEYTIDLPGSFYHFDNNQHVIHITATTRPHRLTLEGNTSPCNIKPSESDVLAEFATFVDCTAMEQSQITHAITAAKEYVAESISYIKNHTAATPRSTTWFGAFHSTDWHATVLKNFNSLVARGNEFSGWKYTCNPAGCDPGIFAYVYRQRLSEVNLCSEFWTAPVTGTDSRAGTLVHEGTHFAATADTGDMAYGQYAAQELAMMDPDWAIWNADSYEYFAENTPRLV